MARKLVSFDWAVKRLLRSKVNFVVLEGLLFELLKEDIKIQDVLEAKIDERIVCAGCQRKKTQQQQAQENNRSSQLHALNN